MFYPYYKNKPKTSVPMGTKEISCGTPFYSTRVIWVLTVLVWSYMIFYIHMLEFKMLGQVDPSQRESSQGQL